MDQMLTPQIQKLIDLINLELPKSRNLDLAVEQVRAQVDIAFQGKYGSLDEHLNKAREYLQSQFKNIEYLKPKSSIVAKRPHWYFGSSPSDLHWPRFRDFLTRIKGWPGVTIRAVDDSSTEIVSLLENPATEKYSGKGLVVGHVQSGKTTSMTAVIAKAVDAGYNTIVVLAGMTNKLRFQTQGRIVGDLVSLNPGSWKMLTRGDIAGDYQTSAHGSLVYNPILAQLAVVKKNVAPLDKLRLAIESANRLHLERLRVLLIDDECDQASVNTGSGEVDESEEVDMTAINERIRTILQLLPAVSYVGYTATPFANVLINPYAADGQTLDDLYPRDFITSLPTPAGYFGAERLFGRPPVDPENVQPEEEGLDMIRVVPAGDMQRLVPPSIKKKDEFCPTMADSLEEALLYFLACCAARRARGDGDKHMTMLVHVSALVVVHKRLAELIVNWKNQHCKDLLIPESGVSTRFQRTWQSEQGILHAEITDAPPVDLDDILEFLPEVLSNLEVAIENSSSEDRIDYTGAARTYIVVGGSILARGLTLEGLMVSYFLRHSRQFDTLLQMGRWFGYRPRYEDLPRIWMTESLQLSFRELAAVENEIREEIERYRLYDLTPMEVAVRIRTIPGMAITGAGKMRAAYRCDVSFWGAHPQTIQFEHQNAAILRQNWDTGATLLNGAEQLGVREGSSPRKLWRRVPKSLVLDFIEGYAVHNSHMDLSANVLLPFLRLEDPRLKFWNVGVVEPKKAAKSVRQLGSAGHVNLVTRARLKDGGNNANIKALMSRRDVLFDCNERAGSGTEWNSLKAVRHKENPGIPLLLLYAIDKDSKPKENSRSRAPLDAVDHILGLGLVFPGPTNGCQ